MPYYGDGTGPSAGKWKRARKRKGSPDPWPCPICRKPTQFTWRCRCGFQMCRPCMDENHWGMTCNDETWVCPDCGDPNPF